MQKTGWKGAYLFGAILFALPFSAAAHSHAAPGHAAHAAPGHTAHAPAHALRLARSHHARVNAFHHGVHVAASHWRHGSLHHGRFHTRLARYRGISCVPFARAESGITLVGNAATWWHEADGRYARGSAPEAGSVLNFRANPIMHLGHVAVVRTVINSRQILVDQANWWGPGGGYGVISRNVAVVDVSPHNDWTAVRVALGRSGNFGSVYPTYGFIYDRADGSDPIAPVEVALMSGSSHLNPAARDLRPRHDRGALADVQTVPPRLYEEVAELPAVRTGH